MRQSVGRSRRGETRRGRNSHDCRPHFFPRARDFFFLAGSFELRARTNQLANPLRCAANVWEVTCIVGGGVRDPAAPCGDMHSWRGQRALADLASRTTLRLIRQAVTPMPCRSAIPAQSKTKSRKDKSTQRHSHAESHSSDMAVIGAERRPRTIRPRGI